MSMPIDPAPDDRGERIVSDPDGYFAAARERTRQEVLAERAARPRHRFRKYAKPVPGVVQLRVTGSTDDDIQAFIDRLTAAGMKAWPANGQLYRHGDGAVCRYYSVVLEESSE